ncbi:MAG TPA: hypothetical protein PLN17_05485, partial [Candidatus Cloacimonas sp.]|nr:hypothetical protein [Candidatus Cloacimonas sp.]
MNRVRLSFESQALSGNLPCEFYVSGTSRRACHSWLETQNYNSFYATHITNSAGTIYIVILEASDLSVPVQTLNFDSYRLKL